MNKTKIKNGYKISVKAWDSKITIQDIKTKKIIKIVDFNDHIKAVMAFTAL